MSFELTRSYGFEAAHWLPKAPEGHKCRRMHGHSFQVDLVVAGDVDEQLGWVMDFATIDASFEPLRARLEHRCLNEIEGLANPTSENLARWIWLELRSALPGLRAVTVYENTESAATYRG